MCINHDSFCRQICAVVVTYCPDDSFLDNIAQLSGSVDRVIVVDNCSFKKDIFRILQDKFCNFVEVIYLNANMGVAAALNVGIHEAKKLRYEWVLTLDQDSRLSLNMINTMLKGFIRRDDGYNIAILAPRYKDNNTGIVSPIQFIVRRDDALRCAEVMHVITSGSLIKLSIFDNVGYFNEQYFIDYVDIEFCLRCLRYGYKILQFDDALLYHSLGASVVKRFLWKNPVATNHSPLRKYYFFRNAIATYKIYYITHPRWVISNFVILLKTLAVVILYEEQKIDKIKAFFLGIFDGVVGNMGVCKRTI